MFKDSYLILSGPGFQFYIASPATLGDYDFKQGYYENSFSYSDKCKGVYATALLGYKYLYITVLRNFEQVTPKIDNSNMTKTTVSDPISKIPKDAGIIFELKDKDDFLSMEPVKTSEEYTDIYVAENKDSYLTGVITSYDIIVCGVVKKKHLIAPKPTSNKLQSANRSPSKSTTLTLKKTKNGNKIKS